MHLSCKAITSLLTYLDCVQSVIIYFSSRPMESASYWSLTDSLAEDQRCGQSTMTSSTGNSFRVTGPLCGEFTGEFPSQRPVTRSFGGFFYLNKRLSAQSIRWWFETPSCSLWRHYKWKSHLYNLIYLGLSLIFLLMISAPLLDFIMIL